MTKAREIKVGSRVEFKSKSHSGKGIVSAIVSTAKGPYYTVKTKDHPKGCVSVRRGQLS